MAAHQLHASTFRRSSSARAAAALFCLLVFLCLPFHPIKSRKIQDCCCDAETIDAANDELLWSRLMSLRTTAFFRTFKVNLHGSCPFWADNGQCELRGCAVCGECGPEEIGSLWQEPPSSASSSSASSASSPSSVSSFSTFSSSPGSRVNTGQLGATFREWSDDGDCLWIEQDADSASSPVSYINLLLNPESFTGYGGESAHEVWRAMYSENCFSSGRMDDLCYEQRVFYRLLSGMHAAISAHIANKYPVSPDIDVHADINEHPELYGPNLDIYDAKLGQHPDRLNNLYFLFVFLLRAVNKATPMLLSFNYSTGDALQDASTASAVRELLTSGIVPSCSPSLSFDETVMFAAHERLPLKLQFRRHFRNISRIMDCVGCEKCRLHGKLQVLGIGTALKVLFNDSLFDLQRNEVVALIGSLGKISNAVSISREMEARRWRRWAGRITAGLVAAAVVGMGAVACWLRWKASRRRKSKQL